MAVCGQVYGRKVELELGLQGGEIGVGLGLLGLWIHAVLFII